MLRSTSFVLAIVCWCAQAQAASEQDRRDCAANQNQDARIAACTRVLDDASSPQALRTIAHRSRGSAYIGKRLFELAVLEFDEALKLSPQDLSALWRPCPRPRPSGTIRPRHCRLYRDAAPEPAQRPRPQRAGARASPQERPGGRAGRLRGCHPDQPAQCARPQQPRIGARQAAQARRGHRRLRRGPAHRSGISAGLQQPGARLRDKGRARAGAGRLQAGGRARGALQARRGRACKGDSQAAARPPHQGDRRGQDRAEGRGREARRPRHRQQRLRSTCRRCAIRPTMPRRSRPRCAGSALPRCASCSMPTSPSSARR